MRDELEAYVVYDVEVVRGPDQVEGGWSNPEAMGFASGVIYFFGKDRYMFLPLGEGQLDMFCTCLKNKVAVSFNGVRFDSRVLLGNARGQYPQLDGTVVVNNDQYEWVEYDLLLQYVRSRFDMADVWEAEQKLGDKEIHDGSFGLDGLSVGTLGDKKIGHGAMAPELYAGGEYAELFAYNLHDVRLTRKLFEFAYEHGFLVDRVNRVVTDRKSVPVTTMSRRSVMPGRTYTLFFPPG